MRSAPAARTFRSALWLLRLRRRGVDVRVMFHEPYFYFSWHRPWRNGLALVQRLMAALLVRASSVAVHFDDWRGRDCLRPLGSSAHGRIADTRDDRNRGITLNRHRHVAVPFRRRRIQVRSSSVTSARSVITSDAS